MDLRDIPRECILQCDLFPAVIARNHLFTSVTVRGMTEFIAKKDLLSATFVANHSKEILVSGYIKQFIMAKNRFLVKLVPKLLHKVRVFSGMKETIIRKMLLLVMHVLNLLAIEVISRNTSGFTQAKRTFHATTVDSPSQHLVMLKLTLEFTLGKSPFPVKIVVKLLLKEAVTRPT